MSSSGLRFLLLLLVVQCLRAENAGGVAGSVLDSQTGRPVPGVAIAVNGMSDSRNVTDADGKFSLSLSPGNYTLRMSAPRYAPVNLTGIVVKAGETLEASTVLSNT